MSEGTGAATARKIVIDIQGLHCGSCSGKVQKALTELDGVTYALVSHEKGEAVVRFAPAVVGADQLVATVSGVGYPASLRS